MTRGAKGLYAVAGLVLAVGGCPGASAAPDCVPSQNAVALPDGLEEASGVAPSRAHPGILWTHSDGRDSRLYAVDASGALRASVRVVGAEMTDWEDLALAQCGASDCIYLADTGDNTEKREAVHILRMKEPALGDSVATVEVATLRYPDGPRNSEALFVLPGERLHVVTKGTNHAVTVYRLPGSLRFDDAPLTLQEVQHLSAGAVSLPREVTGASAAYDGSRIAVRTYEVLTLYRLQSDTLARLPDATVNLRTLREPQGEGVGVGENGRIALVSEAGPGGGRGSLVILRCSITQPTT